MQENICDLYVQSNALLLVDIFEDFQNMFVEMYGLEPALFLTAPRLAQNEALKMTKVKSDLLIDFDIVEKSITGGVFHAIHQYVNASNKYMKDYDKNLC